MTKGRVAPGDAARVFAEPQFSADTKTEETAVGVFREATDVCGMLPQNADDIRVGRIEGIQMDDLRWIPCITLMVWKS